MWLMPLHLRLRLHINQNLIMMMMMKFISDFKPDQLCDFIHNSYNYYVAVNTYLNSGFTYICGKGYSRKKCFVCLFDLILYVPVINFSVISGLVFLG